MVDNSAKYIFLKTEQIISVKSAFRGHRRDHGKSRSVHDIGYSSEKKNCRMKQEDM